MSLVPLYKSQYKEYVVKSRYRDSDGIGLLDMKDIVGSNNVLDIYAVLGGKSYGQTLIGGLNASENLILQSTANATRGYIGFNDAIRLSYSSTVYSSFSTDLNGYLFINSTGGKFGIGKVPTCLLDIYGTGAICTSLGTSSTGLVLNYLRFQYAGVDKAYIGFADSSNNFYIQNRFTSNMYFYNNDTFVMSADSAGSLGVGAVPNGITRFRIGGGFNSVSGYGIMCEIDGELKAYQNNAILASLYISNTYNHNSKTGVVDYAIYAPGINQFGYTGIGIYPTEALDVSIGVHSAIKTSGSGNPLIYVTSTTGTIITKMQSVASDAGYIGTESNHVLKLISNNAVKMILGGTHQVNIDQLTTTGCGLYVNRYLTSTSTDSSVMYIRQEHASDDQCAVEIRQEGSAAALKVSKGDILVSDLAGVGDRTVYADANGKLHC